MRISTKMIIGYVLLIVLPFLLFTVFVYMQLYDKLLTQYQLSNQQNIEQLAGNLDSTLGKIESLQSIYQNNAALIDYLRDEYTDDRDLIYFYLREISPAISFATLAEPSVQSLTIYPKSQKRLLTVTGFRPFYNIYDKLSRDEINALRPSQGLWKKSVSAKEISLTYYQKIYNDTFTRDLGIIELSVEPKLLGDFMQNIRDVHRDNAILLMDKQGNSVDTPFQSNIPQSQISNIMADIHSGASKSFLAWHDQLLVNSVSIPRLGLTVIEINKQNVLFEFLRVKQLWVAGGFLLLGLLSVSYYLIVSSLTKRIVMLSRHMRKVGQDSLGKHFAGHTGRDEIGFLITSYNAMITRIDELVYRVQKVELLKKEADFKMLQAQIQPHFLYNTLETMRMLARSNQGRVVAEMAFSLGNLLRYSLSKNTDTILKEELEQIRSYMSIHQIRMKDLIFDLDVEESVLTVSCPRFILQPLVENSMIHGLSRKRGVKRIGVSIKKEVDRMMIEVEDNGAGIEPDKLVVLKRILNGDIGDGVIETQGTGIGLSNVAERVRAYFGPNSEINIINTPGKGTRCTLKLTMKENGHAQADDRGR
ncbi:histidine kinase [Paenibacillus sp. sptzw28]|uniref:sensor histidine kinase n=1 Tax=Paenibacillus sp. sptzw28 TaxID=715179 RepID=UPI001C6E9261|nr:sensor histidine kinase [Paenibacillus sp. sptzw28]QYR23101.1 histidine kinase [Paenibacillus sp. sptzw28]